MEGKESNIQSTFTNVPGRENAYTFGGPNLTISNSGSDNGITFLKIKPASYLNITWDPKEDITVFELAQCQNILIIMARGPVMEDWVDTDKPFMRHFNIIYPNTTK